MTRIESRNSQARENETREETEYVFEEPNATFIPREVEERYKETTDGVAIWTSTTTTTTSTNAIPSLHATSCSIATICATTTVISTTSTTSTCCVHSNQSNTRRFSPRICPSRSKYLL